MQKLIAGLLFVVVLELAFIGLHVHMASNIYLVQAGVLAPAHAATGDSGVTGQCTTMDKATFNLGACQRCDANSTNNKCPEETECRAGGFAVDLCLPKDYPKK